MHNEHSRHEDVVVYKFFQDLFPGQPAPWTHDHDADHVALHTLQEKVCCWRLLGTHSCLVRDNGESKCPLNKCCF